MAQCQCLNASGANKGKQCSNKSKPGSKWCGTHKNCKGGAGAATKPVSKPKAKPVSKPKAKPVSKPKAKPVSKPKAKPVSKSKSIKPYGTYGGAPAGRAVFETYKKYNDYPLQDIYDDSGKKIDWRDTTDTDVAALKAAVKADYTGWWDEQCRVLSDRNGTPVMRPSNKTQEACDAHWDVRGFTPLTDEQLFEAGLLTEDEFKEVQASIIGAIEE
jgi:hypothetical protein